MKLVILLYPSESQRTLPASVIQSLPSERFVQNSERSSESGYLPLIPIIAISSFSSTELFSREYAFLFFAGFISAICSSTLLFPRFGRISFTASG